MNRTTLALFGLVALAPSGCRPGSTAPEPPVATSDLPSVPGPLAPAMTRTAGSGPVDGLHLTDVDTCDTCHPDLFAQQQASAHATSSFNNPIYRFGIDQFRAAVSNRASQMCGGCHDVSLLVDGAMTAAVSPADERAHAGITCRVCHGIDAATNDGNGSYTLSMTPLPLPDGSTGSVDAHRGAAAPIDRERLCGSCHRSFLSQETGNAHFLPGMDDLSAWKGSAFNHSGFGRVDDPVPRKGCVDCHMPMEPARRGDVAADADGRVRSHRFVGAHTWLAAMQGDAEQLARQRAMLRGTLTVDIAAVRDQRGRWTRPAEGAPVVAGERLWLDVVVRNLGVGHSFPAGVKDAVDSWLEISITDATGAVIAGSGDDDQAHRFRALVGDRDGVPQLIRNTHSFHQLIVDQTIPARDARVIRYALDVPAGLAAARLPLRVEARLMHRSRNLALQRAVCAASRSQRGRAFDEQRIARGKPALDPCAPQPVTEIARAVTWIGDGAADRRERTAAAPRWRRLYEHGLGLLAELPAEAANARDSLLAARAALGPTGAAIDRAKVLAALAAVYTGAPCGPSAAEGWPSCQGRLATGLRWVDEAEALVPGHPAVAALRARLHNAAARWREAADWWRIAVDRVPENAAGWRALATALGAVGEHARALDAAERGLTLLPRDDDLLRVRALALAGLGGSEEVVRDARASYRARARAERPTELWARCAANDPACGRESRLVHSHQLRAP